ncbi:MAG: penicillin acylase family protein [Deltaproteobacteria bacterium]|nr:penicillin acylase family protein [Deltaproteobacteria bacterium]
MRSIRSIAVVVFVASTVCFSGCATWSYLWYRVAPDYPEDESGTIELPGLKAPVKVFLDPAGIPHIDARDDEDLFRATGFVQARDRFFQMDVMRRFARGRLSELVGRQKVPTGSTVDVDRAMRGWGIEKASADDAKALGAETRRLVEAFAAGVNRAREVHEPVEYRLIEVDPEPWTVEDTFAIGRLNAWGVSHNWHQEIARLILALHGGLDRAEKIYPSDWWRGGTSIQATGDPVTLPPAIPEPLKGMFPPRGCATRTTHDSRPTTNDSRLTTYDRSATGSSSGSLFPPDSSFTLHPSSFSSASNAWVVSGDMSVSGRPIVANDPHMAHMLPAILYQQHLRTPDLDVIGATVPGIPWVLAGHNRHAAWGMTSAVADAIDLYIEKVDPTNPEEYETPDGKKARFEREDHIVGHRDGDVMTERQHTIRRTVHGPILNDMYPDLFPKWAPPIALSWDAPDAWKSVAALGRANRAKTVEELRAALAFMSTPATIWTAADDTGTIAVFATGSVPVRKGHLGTFPAPGWSKCCGWDGNVDPASLPGATSKTGFFAHANNLMTDPGKSKVLFNIDSAPSYRFDRIADLVRAQAKHDSRSMSAIQQDTKLMRAQKLVPAMLSDLKEAAGLSALETAARTLLEKWDFSAGPDSAPAAVFFVTYRESVIAALQDEVDEPGFEFILAQRYSTNVADLWHDNPEHVVWDNRCTPATETRKDVITGAFKKAVASLAKDFGPDPAKWRWGAIHDVHHKHLFGSKKELDTLVNLPRMEAAGGLDSVWKSHFDLAHPETPFRAMAGPVYRMIVDLGDIDHAHWIIDTGASGWPGSPHYGDQHELWKRGELVPMTFDWKEIVSGAKGVLELVP